MREEEVKTRPNSTQSAVAAPTPGWREAPRLTLRGEGGEVAEEAVELDALAEVEQHGGGRRDRAEEPRDAGLEVAAEVVGSQQEAAVGHHELLREAREAGLRGAGGGCCTRSHAGRCPAPRAAAGTCCAARRSRRRETPPSVEFTGNSYCLVNTEIGIQRQLVKKTMGTDQNLAAPERTRRQQELGILGGSQKGQEGNRTNSGVEDRTRSYCSSFTANVERMSSR